jgi:hypothetical protein
LRLPSPLLTSAAKSSIQNPNSGAQTLNIYSEFSRNNRSIDIV